MSDLMTRAQARVHQLEQWAHRGRARSLAAKVLVTVAGPLLILLGIAMTVLPGPGLVVVAIGLTLLALEYEWARSALRLMGRTLSRARTAAMPRDGSPGRRFIGLACVGAFAVATGALTAAVTTLLGAQAIL